MRGMGAIFGAKYGAGQVIISGPHPEASKKLKEFTWELIKRTIPPSIRVYHE